MKEKKMFSNQRLVTKDKGRDKNPVIESEWMNMRAQRQYSREGVIQAEGESCLKIQMRRDGKQES